MTSRERVEAALTGRACDRVPIVAPYLNLFTMDHFGELTGEPQWRVHEWLHAEPEDYAATLARMYEVAPFELVFPHGSHERGWRARQRFREVDGVPWRRDKETGDEVSLASRSGMTYDDRPNQARRILSAGDAEAIACWPAERMWEAGHADYARATVERMGDDRFVVAGGVVGAVWGSTYHCGVDETMRMLVEEPEVLDALRGRLLAQAFEDVRCHAGTGARAVFVDESGATSDMISPAHYARYALPYTQAVVEAIHAAGLLAIVYYFGGVMDRLDLIAETGADAVLVECSMKGYTNDIAAIAERLGGRMSLFGNIDPVWCLERGAEESLRAEIARQLEAGKRARGFLLSTGSPITPTVPLSRVLRYLEWARDATGG